MPQILKSMFFGKFFESGGVAEKICGVKKKCDFVPSYILQFSLFQLTDGKSMKIRVHSVPNHVFVNIEKKGLLNKRKYLGPVWPADVWPADDIHHSLLFNIWHLKSLQ